MKAIAVKYDAAKGKPFPQSVHLTDIAEPDLHDLPTWRKGLGDREGRGVKVEVLEVGVDGTDSEIMAAEYGAAPKGEEVLVIGHESFGRVIEVGPAVTELEVGDFVTATVRRPGVSPYDAIGENDMTTDTVYYERGINLLHGFLTEYYVDEPEYIVRVPPGLKHVGVLMEPMSVVEKGIFQAWEIQRRLKVWKPQRALVLGAGAIGQLATLVLRMRGLEVTTVASTPGPHKKQELIDQLGAKYVSAKEESFGAIKEKYGRQDKNPGFDFIFEATGNSMVVCEALKLLSKNGILCLTSITGGEREVTIPADEINLDFVLNNKVMFGTVNAHRGYFEMGVSDFALSEASYPGWLSSLLTHPVSGIDNYNELFEKLADSSSVKAYLKMKDF